MPAALHVVVPVLRGAGIERHAIERDGSENLIRYGRRRCRDLRIERKAERVILRRDRIGRAEGRGERAEGRGQRAEGRGKRAEGREIMFLRSALCAPPSISLCASPSYSLCATCSLRS